MLGRLKIFVVLAMCCTWSAFAADSSISNFNDFFDLISKLGWNESEDAQEKEMFEYASGLKQQLGENTEELEKNYEDLKANEQSLANRTLTAVTTAATGIGGMELAQGLAEQKADKDADQNMRAYIATMKCTYANGKTVKASPAEVELPGGNDQQLMNYRAEYLSLASDLKERKNALGMKAGIESEEILDKVASGLYDDENVGIESGAYESRYRALMLGSEQDQAMLDEAAEKSSKRVKAGAIAAGAGVLVGVAGNALINMNGPQDRSAEILEERENITKEIKDFIDQKIAKCNAAIEEAKSQTQQIQSDPVLGQNEDFQTYIQMTESATKVETKEDLLKENPFCR